MASLRAPQGRGNPVQPGLLRFARNDAEVEALSLALGLDQRRGDRFLRGLVRPEHELEDRIEALAFLDRRLDQSLGLLQAERAALVALEQGGVAEQDEARGGP